MEKWSFFRIPTKTRSLAAWIGCPECEEGNLLGASTSPHRKVPDKNRQHRSFSKLHNMRPEPIYSKKIPMSIPTFGNFAINSYDGNRKAMAWPHCCLGKI
jgi:hypothetical protein